jgi:hypothetical protein
MLTVGSEDFRLTVTNRIANLTDKPWPSHNSVDASGHGLSVTAGRLATVAAARFFLTERHSLEEAGLSHLIPNWSLKFVPRFALHRTRRRRAA